MTDAGRRAVEVAKANGWWTIYDAVEDLLEPDDLADALDACPGRPHRVGRVPAVGPQADAVVGHQRGQTRDPRRAASPRSSQRPSTAAEPPAEPTIPCA